MLYNRGQCLTYNVATQLMTLCIQTEGFNNNRNVISTDYKNIRQLYTFNPCKILLNNFLKMTEADIFDECLY